MFKRRFKSHITLFLLMLMSISLTITTLHSHHNLDWHQSPDFADTGHCLTADATVCPICGHLVKADLSPEIQATAYFIPSFDVEDYEAPALSSRIYIPASGRSPPVLA